MVNIVELLEVEPEIEAHVAAQGVETFLKISTAFLRFYHSYVDFGYNSALEKPGLVLGWQANPNRLL